MTVLLDTDVLVDCLRGTPAARTWLEQATAESFQVPGIVAMELLAGCQNKADLERTRKFITAFDVVWPEAAGPHPFRPPLHLQLQALQSCGRT